MGDAAPQPADQQQREHWREFGVWLEKEALSRYASKQEFATAADIAWHSVNDLFNGGRAQPGGGWRLPNPNDSTLRKVARALGQTDAAVFKRAGGTYKQRNPDRSYPGQVSATQRDRLAALEEKVERVVQRNQELEDRQRQTMELLRAAGIPIPGENGGASDDKRPRRRRNPG